MTLAARTLLVASLVTSFAALAGCGHAPPRVSPDLDPALAPRADTQGHAAAPNGLRLGAPLAGVAYGPNQGTTWSVPLQQGHCYAFGYASDASVAKVTMTLTGPNGKREDTARNTPPDGVYRHCPSGSGMYQLEAKVARGAGHFVVVPYDTPPAPATPGAPTVVLVSQPAVVVVPAPAPAH